MEHLEIYDRARYFTFTGDHLAGTPAEINECQSDITRLSEFLFGSENNTEKESARSSEPVLTDEEVLQRIERMVEET